MIPVDLVAGRVRTLCDATLAELQQSVSEYNDIVEKVRSIDDARRKLMAHHDLKGREVSVLQATLAVLRDAAGEDVTRDGLAPAVLRVIDR